jgi:hypothetical protein
MPMNTLIFVKGLTGCIVFLAAVVATLLQLQTRKLIPAVFPLKGARLTRWHLWMGRTALGGTLFVSVVCILIGFYPIPRLDPRHLIHIALGLLTALAFAGKLFIVRRRVRWGMQHMLPLGLGMLTLQVGIFASATAFALWGRIAGLI